MYYPHPGYPHASFSQPGYPQPTYAQPGFAPPGFTQAGWPATSMPLPSQSQAAPLAPTITGADSKAKEIAASQAQVIMPQMISGIGNPQIGTVPYVATTQEPPASPSLAEAKYAKLASYYMNPYYGMKAELARKKSEKKLVADKVIMERKVLLDWNKHLKAKQRELGKLRRVLAKRENYWSRTAEIEGVDLKTISDERRTLASQRLQLTKDETDLAENKSILRSRQRVAGTILSESEGESSELSGSDTSEASSSNMFEDPVEDLEGHRGKAKYGFGKGKGRAASNKSKKSNHGWSRSRNARDSDLPASQKPRDLNTSGQMQEMSNSLGVQLAGPSFSSQNEADFATKAQVRAPESDPHLDSQLRLPNTYRQSLSSRPTLTAEEEGPSRSLPTALPTTLPMISQDTEFPGRVLLNNLGHRGRTVSQYRTSKDRPPLTSPGLQEAPKMSNKSEARQPGAAIIQVHFPHNVIYLLTRQQVEYDHPNAFSQVLQDCRHKLKPGKKLRVPIKERRPQAFNIIHEYMEGNNILPLSDHHCFLLTNASTEHRQACKMLLQEARFYGLRGLSEALQPFLKAPKEADADLGGPSLRTDPDPVQRPKFLRRDTPAPPKAKAPSLLDQPSTPFLLLDLGRKGRLVDIAELQQLLASNAGSLTPFIKMPNLRAVAIGAAVK